MFAVIKTGGKQYRVAEDQTLKIEKIEGEPGQIVQLGNVLMLGGDKPEIGYPPSQGASIAVEIVEQGRGAKVIAFKKRRRKNSRRRRGHRQAFTLVRVSEILTGGAPRQQPRPTQAEARSPRPKPGREPGRLRAAQESGAAESRAESRKVTGMHGQVAALTQRVSRSIFVR